MRVASLVIAVLNLLVFASPASAAAPPHRPPVAHEPSTDEPSLQIGTGGFSFRGLSTPTGSTSAAHEFRVAIKGLRPRALRAVTHGDFVITKNTCDAAALLTTTAMATATGTSTSTAATCSILVAFKPSADGLRTGDLTLDADGVQAQAVALDAGTPIDFPTVGPHLPAVQWVELPSGTGAVAASVTGPFAIALQANYTYGNIDGINFAGTASTDGVCSPTAAPPCRIFLGIKLLQSALLRSSGTVSLSNGLTYVANANELWVSFVFTPAKIDFTDGIVFGVPLGSQSDMLPLTLTNNDSIPIKILNTQVTGPFKATNQCPASLAPAASCRISTLFTPTAVGAATGELIVSTGRGNVAVPLAGAGVDNPFQVLFEPAGVTFDLAALPPGTGSPVSAGRTQKITNLSATDTITVGPPVDFIPPPFDDPCINSGSIACPLLHTTCSTLPPKASCDAVWEAHEQFIDYNDNPVAFPIAPGLADFSNQFTWAITKNGATTNYSMPMNFTFDGVTGPLILSTNNVRVSPTSYGRAGAPQKITVTNTTPDLTLQINVTGTGYDFYLDPTCGPLLPGKSCQLTVYYIPEMGHVSNSVTYVVNATQFGGSALIVGAATFTVSGETFMNAALKTPAAPPFAVSSSVSDSLQIRNVSGVPLKIAQIASAELALDVHCPTSLGAGESCTIDHISLDANYNYNHSAAGPGDLDIFSNAWSSPDVYGITAPVGDKQAVRLSATIPPFPPTPVGSTSSVTAAISGFSLNGTDFLLPLFIEKPTGGAFGMISQCPPILTSTNPSFGQIGAACNVILTFTPKTPGIDWGILGVQTPDGNQTALAAGVGVSPPLTASPASLILVTQPGSPVSQNVQFTNHTDAAMLLDVPALIASPFIDFGISVTANTCSPALAPHASCSVTLTTKSGAAVASGFLLIPFDQYELTKLPVYATPAPVSLQFGELSAAIGQTAVATGSVFNASPATGAFPIKILAIIPQPGNGPELTVTGTSCTSGITLNAQQACAIAVKFTPTTTQVKPYLFTINTDLGDFTSTIYGVGQH